MLSRTNILFVSTMAHPWGGSEELWSQTALKLVARGVSVTASVEGNSPLHDRVIALAQGGIDVQPRARRYPLWKRLWRRVNFRRDSYLVADVQKLIDAKRPSLVVFSDGGPVSPVELLELCVAKRVPFVTIGTGNTEYWWADDELAQRYQGSIGICETLLFRFKCEPAAI